MDITREVDVIKFLCKEFFKPFAITIFCVQFFTFVL